MDNKLNVSIQQPSIPNYRRPLFEKINKIVKLSLYYGFDGVPSDLPDQIEKHFYPYRIFRIAGCEIKWHTAQLKAINKKTDVSILSWDAQYITLWLSILKKGIIRKPLILWGHGYSKSDFWIKRGLRNIPLRFADAVILYDHHTAGEIRKIDLYKQKVFVAPNSIEQEQINDSILRCFNDKAGLEVFKEQQGISKSFNVIYIGRIYEANKLELLLDAVSKCHKVINEFKLIIIGKENHYTDVLKKMSEELAISNKIIWAGEIYNEDRIALWMLSSHVLCYPDNIGLSIMHAFGYGLPVITSNTYKSHGPEIWSFKDEVNGLAYRSGDSEDFSWKILRLYNDPELRLKLAKSAKETVEKDYTIDKMVEGFMNAITYVLNR